QFRRYTSVVSYADDGEALLYDVLERLDALAQLEGGPSPTAGQPTFELPPSAGTEIEGPRHQPIQIPDPDFLPVQERYRQHFKDWPRYAQTIADASTNRELVNAISKADYAATGDAGHFKRVLLHDDPQLAAL